jgi:hypothetical protein
MSDPNILPHVCTHSKLADAPHGTGEGGYCKTHDGRWAGVVRNYIENLRFGEVILTVHDGRVVQIERSEKVRF